MSKYTDLFVYIYLSAQTVEDEAVTDTTFYISSNVNDAINKTGIRVGMNLVSTSTTPDTTLTTNVTVTAISYDESLDDGKWKITTNKAHNLVANNEAIFKAPRVLNFSKNNIITGINVLDDFIFWTDNDTEPKKRNIPRSIAGTGGTTKLNSIYTDIVKGDYDYFHTRIVSDKD